MILIILSFELRHSFFISHSSFVIGLEVLQEAVSKVEIDDIGRALVGAQRLIIRDLIAFSPLESFPRHWM
ncbi:MAG: hypothetical protein L0Z50_29300 [Verrucomicrobiales bacterium]|nr:hypothetical protein [Verrucomicrobiales bacterium]